jgi:hypothetical protein
MKLSRMAIIAGMLLVGSANMSLANGYHEGHRYYHRGPRFHTYISYRVPVRHHRHWRPFIWKVRHHRLHHHAYVRVWGRF